MKSILQSEKVCYLCGKQYGLERHHCISGFANRKISEHYGLWVWLCHNCHTGKDGAQYNKEKNLLLKQDAQRAFMAYYSKRLWMQLIRKNYIGDWGGKDE